MTDPDILKLCKSLARRYKNQNQYDDLVSEGLLACYELRETGSATDKQEYSGWLACNERLQQHQGKGSQHPKYMGG
jgi:hypothetical protein